MDIQKGLVVTDSTPFQPMPVALVTIGQAATALQISSRTVYRLIESGELKPVKIGRLVRIPVSQIYSWIDKQSQTEDNGSCTEPHDTSGGVLCRNEKRTATGSVVGRTVRSGGRPLPTQAVKGLDDLLAR